MDPQAVSGLDWVRTKEKDLFATGHVNAMGLMAYVTADVLELGRGVCHIVRSDSWWLVSSDVDWMLHATIPVPRLFERVVAAPQHGEHSLRAEVLLAAFAKDVLTGTSAGGRVIVKGAPPDEGWVERNLDPAYAKRYVVFGL